MIAFGVGVALAIMIGVVAKITNFDRDRSFYATVLIVIANYYVLFAFISCEAIFLEILIASIFSLVALVGALRLPILLGIGILMHGVFDFTHGHVISNSGVPIWWPSFCAGIDVALGLWVIYLVQVKRYFKDPSEIT